MIEEDEAVEHQIVDIIHVIDIFQDASIVSSRELRQSNNLG
jgi:hypothetical protein